MGALILAAATVIVSLTAHEIATGLVSRIRGSEMESLVTSGVIVIGMILWFLAHPRAMIIDEQAGEISVVVYGVLENFLDVACDVFGDLPG